MKKTRWDGRKGERVIKVTEGVGTAENKLETSGVNITH